MTVSLTEFKLDLNRYLEIAKFTDVQIVSPNQNRTWLLTSTHTLNTQTDPKKPWWGRKVIAFLQPGTVS